MVTKNDALKKMLDKLDNRSHDSVGYTTYTEEAVAILNELSARVPVSLTVSPSAHHDDVNVTLQIGFTVSRTELEAADHEDDEEIAAIVRERQNMGSEPLADVAARLGIDLDKLEDAEADLAAETWNSNPAVGEENELLDEAHCRESGLHLTDVDDDGYCNFCGHGHEDVDNDTTDVVK